MNNHTTGFIEKKQGYKTAISDLQNFVFFFKKYFQKIQKIWKFWIILRFSKFSKNRNICVRNLSSACTLKISAWYQLCYGSEKVFTSRWVNGTDPYKPHFWHYSELEMQCLETYSPSKSSITIAMGNCSFVITFSLHGK